MKPEYPGAGPGPLARGVMFAAATVLTGLLLGGQWLLAGHYDAAAQLAARQLPPLAQAGAASAPRW